MPFVFFINRCLCVYACVCMSMSVWGCMYMHADAYVTCTHMRRCVAVCMSMDACVHECIYVHAHICMCTNTHISVCACVYAHTYMCVNVCGNVYACTHMCENMCMYVCMSVYVCVCMCVHVCRERERGNVFVCPYFSCSLLCRGWGINISLYFLVSKKIYIFVLTALPT